MLREWTFMEMKAKAMKSLIDEGHEDRTREWHNLISIGDSHFEVPHT